MSCLSILEVSQKQAYIFKSNKLQNNIINSAVIAHVTSSEYFKNRAPGLFTEENIVYAGGGHTVFEFPEKSKAVEFNEAVTQAAMQDYPGLELFCTTLETEKDPTADDLKKLSEKLEAKKSIRRASFSHGTFGIEAIDINNGDPTLTTGNDAKKPESEEIIDKKLSPDGFERAFKFENLGGTKNQKNFIAVVHIDGNSMGARVEKLRESMKGKPWKEYKDKLKAFSKSIDDDFKSAYLEMCNKIADLINDNKLNELGIGSSNNRPFFPVRRIITAGDDICFVTEGRIGIESARLFVECLSEKKNKVDEQGYAACAGVAIVHQKYPFYKAYELAEMLCSNAKKFIASRGGQEASASNSAIDWHIEYGEVADSLDDVRAAYKVTDGTHKELRPFIIKGDGKVLSKDPSRDYSIFKKLVIGMKNDDQSFARGKIKQLREAISRGENIVELYLTQNLMGDLKYDGYPEKGAYVTTSDGVKRSKFFDAIEILDTFLPLDSEVEE